MFPYGGYKKATEKESAFWDIVNLCQPIDVHNRPIVVVNADTESRNQADTFFKDKRIKDLEYIRVWSVDTCQMWLAGWGYVLDNYPEVERVGQVPGDLVDIRDKKNFLGMLGNMMRFTEAELVIGDFDTGNPYSAKELIDTYGTRPLLANWFPDISKAIQQLRPPLTKIRSEFLNIHVDKLKRLLRFRKFAYEQTLNMIIRCWRPEERLWGCVPTVFPLGTIKDETSFRSFRGCLDQIERTERMLKLVWREIYEPKSDDVDDYRKFTDQYEGLDRRSRWIRENARISVRAFLGA